jgi:hypothetical protein
MDAELRLRAELLEETLAELLRFVVDHDFYDDQLDEDTSWERRLRPYLRPDGLAPMAPLYEDSFVRLDEVGTDFRSLAGIVSRAETLLGDRYDGALGRARLRRRLDDRDADGQPNPSVTQQDP